MRYAILLGVWVSVTAIIPYLGAFLGGIPAVLVALVFGSSIFESYTTTAILTVVAYVLIQQLEGNFLTPRIQGQALHVHPIVVLLAVIAGGELAGLAGIIFAVPALAVFRVLFDFFRVRLRSGKPSAARLPPAFRPASLSAARPTLVVSTLRPSASAFSSLFGPLCGARRMLPAVGSTLIATPRDDFLTRRRPKEASC